MNSITQTKNGSIENTELKLLHHNIRSLNAHFGELMALLHSLGDTFDFTALSEIGKCNLENRNRELEKFGFKLVSQPFLLSKGRVGLIHRKDINLTERNDLKIKCQEINGSKIVHEDLWYETNYSDSRADYVIGVE